MGIKYSIQLNAPQLELLETVWKNKYKLIRPKRVHLDGVGISWSEQRVRRIARSLYGLVALFEGDPRKYKSPIIGYLIPFEITDFVERALKNNGVFERELKPRDLHVLRTMYDRDQQLKRKYGNTWNPRFHHTTIEKLTKKGKQSARASLNRLVGLIGLSLTDDLFVPKSDVPSAPMSEIDTSDLDWFISTEHKHNVPRVPVYQIYVPRWFLPTARMPVIEQLI